MEKLISFLIKNKIWTNAIILLVLFLGLVSIDSIKKAFFPEVNPDQISIQVVYPGASPEEVEEGIVNKVEESLKGLQGIKDINSTASENVASISVEIDPDYDEEVVLADVKNSVDKINSFPVDAEKPVVYNLKPQGDAASMILIGDFDLVTLKKYAEDIKDDLLDSRIISQVTISGYPEYEISVEIPEESLIRYGLTFDQVSNAIRLNNRDISSGSIKTSKEEILIRSRNKEYDSDGIGNIILRTNQDGSILRIKDVATLKDQFTDTPDKIEYNGKNAVAIQVNKLPEEDVLEITSYVRQYMKEFNAAGDGIELVMLLDRSDYLWQRLDLLIENGVIGLIMVLILLTLFLNLRLSAWVAFGIPFSFLGMMFIATLVGITINMISLFGMILVVGILVDDGIVVGENIFAHYEKGKSRLRAAVDGAVEVLPAVFASVLTTIIAFSIFFFIEGRVGKIIFEMAVVVILSLAFSLVECVFILPPHLAHSKALKEDDGKASPIERGINWIRNGVDKGMRFVRDKIYGPFLLYCVRYRYITFAAALVIVMTVSGLLGGKYIQTTFFPFIDSDDIDISLVLKPGTRETETEAFLQDIEEKIYQLNEELKAERPDGKDVVVGTRLTVGSAGGGGGGPVSSGGGTSGGHTGAIKIYLMPGEERDMETFLISNRLKKLVGEIPEAEQFTIGARRIFGKPINISLKSRNLAELDGAKQLLKDELRKNSALKDVTDSNIPGAREINIQLKPKAYILGLSHNDITRQIRQGYFGDESQRLQIGTDEVKVWVRYPPEDRKSLGDLENIRIRTQTGQEYPLNELIDYETERGVVSIQHLNGAREVRIEADLVDQEQASDPIIEDIQNTTIAELRSRYPGLSVSFEGQQRSSQDFNSSLSVIGPAALLLIFLIIALTFRSFSQATLIILGMVPLGIIGAILGHYFEGRNISILSSYGIIALSGVIVNDAVVFTDKFNRLLAQGHSFISAVFYAGKSRFRPILLTSLTTVAGLYPIILETSRQAQFLIPMAVSVAYGVLIGTFFILTVYPAILGIYNDVRVGWVTLRRLVWNWELNPPSRTEVEPAVKNKKEIQELNDESV